MSISINPMVTTGISGGFVVSTDGYVQGTFLDDPAMRYQLEGGQVDSGQTTPLWGGLAVALKVPAVPSPGITPASSPSVLAATSLGSIAGFTLFNQASAGIITPSSNVPLYAAGMSINFARLGSLLRVCLKVKDTTVLDALAGAAPDVALYWDPTNLYLTTTSGGNYGPLPVQLEFLSATSKTVSYDSGTGFANWVPDGPAAIVRI